MRTVHFRRVFGVQGEVSVDEVRLDWGILGIFCSGDDSNSIISRYSYNVSFASRVMTRLITLRQRDAGTGELSSGVACVTGKMRKESTGRRRKHWAFQKNVFERSLGCVSAEFCTIHFWSEI